MNIDLPLILTVIVGASGAIWLIDSFLFAPARSERLAELQKQYPRWNESESADANLFVERVSREATDPVVVEYAKSFFPLLASPASLSRREGEHGASAGWERSTHASGSVEGRGGRFMSSRLCGSRSMR